MRLRRFLSRPGDGRPRPQIPASNLLWALLIGTILREGSFHGVEALVRSPARRRLGVGRCFGDDALAYFTERLAPSGIRGALVDTLKLAKRNKAFENSLYVGLALDGTGAARCEKARCDLCHPVKNDKGELICYLHHFSMITVVGTGLTLPFDVEPYGPKDCEYNASQRLLERAVTALGLRFAQYVVGDGAYATAPFLHLATRLGLFAVARLKANLPDLFTQAESYFASMKPTATTQVGRDRIELWDADHFDPWESLEWKTVRVLRYRQHKPGGKIVEAYWLTNFPTDRVSSLTLYGLAKSRWEIENQGFNDGKNRYGMEHMCHHHANSLLISWLLIALALTIERLFRLRYLHRGTHPQMTPIELLRTLRLCLGDARYNSS